MGVHSVDALEKVKEECRVNWVVVGYILCNGFEFRIRVYIGQLMRSSRWTVFCTLLAATMDRHR